MVAIKSLFSSPKRQKPTTDSPDASKSRRWLPKPPSIMSSSKPNIPDGTTVMSCHHLTPNDIEALLQALSPSEQVKREFLSSKTANLSQLQKNKILSLFQQQQLSESPHTLTSRLTGEPRYCSFSTTGAKKYRLLTQRGVKQNALPSRTIAPPPPSQPVAALPPASSSPPPQPPTKPPRHVQSGRQSAQARPSSAATPPTAPNSAGKITLECHNPDQGPVWVTPQQLKTLKQKQSMFLVSGTQKKVARYCKNPADSSKYYVVPSIQRIATTKTNRKKRVTYDGFPIRVVLRKNYTPQLPTLQQLEKGKDSRNQQWIKTDQLTYGKAFAAHQPRVRVKDESLLSLASYPSYYVKGAAQNAVVRTQRPTAPVNTSDNCSAQNFHWAAFYQALITKTESKQAAKAKKSLATLAWAPAPLVDFGFRHINKVINVAKKFSNKERKRYIDSVLSTLGDTGTDLTKLTKKRLVQNLQATVANKQAQAKKDNTSSGDVSTLYPFLQKAILFELYCLFCNGQLPTQHGKKLLLEKLIHDSWQQFSSNQRSLAKTVSNAPFSFPWVSSHSPGTDLLSKSVFKEITTYKNLEDEAKKAIGKLYGGITTTIINNIDAQLSRRSKAVIDTKSSSSLLAPWRPFFFDNVMKDTSGKYVLHGCKNQKILGRETSTTAAEKLGHYASKMLWRHERDRKMWDAFLKVGVQSGLLDPKALSANRQP